MDGRTLNFDTTQVLVMVLAGGEGKRLYPLTLDRAKPAVPFGGRYRIIDIVLSNFVNSGLARIKVLTQYKSASLEEHIARNWRLSPILDQFIEAIPAQQRTGKTWYRGSADAVWQCQHVINDENPELVCIFGGDHVYKMDVRQMLAFHQEGGPTRPSRPSPCPRHEARDFGVIEVDDGGRIVALPREGRRTRRRCRATRTCASRRWATTSSSPTSCCASSTRTTSLEESRHDFGHDILPRLVQKGAHVFAYDFATNIVPGEDEHNRGYWRDVGTVDAYWEAQMDLIEIHPQFNLYNFRWPIRTGATHDPPAKFVFRDEAQARVGIATDSLVSHGCIISGGRIHRSVLGVGCRVNSFSEVEESVLFERVRVGRHAKIRRAIIDKDVEIPSGTVIGFDREADRQRFFVTDSGRHRRHPQAREARRGLGWVERSSSATCTGARASSRICSSNVRFHGARTGSCFVGDLVVAGPIPHGTLDLVAPPERARSSAATTRSKLLAWRRRRKPLGPDHQRVAQPAAEARLEDAREAPASGSTCPSTASASCTRGVVPGLPMHRVAARGAAQDADHRPRAATGATRGTPARCGGRGTRGRRTWSSATTRTPGPRSSPWATGIDTGCVYGGRLTALVLEEGEALPRGNRVRRLLKSVPARRKYYGGKGGP